jgi:hypothetical protein
LQRHSRPGGFRSLAEIEVARAIRCNDPEAFASLVQSNLGLQARRQDDGAFLISE